MTFQQAAKWLAENSAAGIKPGLTTIRALCQALGNPQDKVPAVVVAGTNGKGAVCAFAASALHAAGYRTGVYTSPAVFDRLEQYCIGAVPVTEADFAAACDKIAAVLPVLATQSIYPTAFELETAVAFVLFADAACDIMLLECGMGGQLDAVNCVSSKLVSVLTPIALEHTRFLGNTLTEIATQKVGILSDGGTLVTTTKNAAVLPLLRTICAQRHAELQLADLSLLSDFRIVGGMQSVTYAELQKLQLGIAGSYQTENAALAATLCRVLHHKGFPMTEQQLRAGFRAARHPGRFEQCGRQPVYILDGAHNPHGMTQFCKSLLEYFPSKKITFVMGVFADKDYPQMLALLAPLAYRFLAITPENPRALPAQALCHTAQALIPNAEAMPTVSDAIRAAASPPDGIVAVCGSLSFLAQAKHAIQMIAEDKRSTNHGQQQN